MVTRVFDSRAQAFIKHSLMRSGYSGLKVKNYCYRIEFQARGMPHIHGVLWLEKESIKDYLLNPILGGLWNYVTGRGGPLWPGWILAILRLSVGILKPKNDFHQTFLIFGCP